MFVHHATRDRQSSQIMSRSAMRGGLISAACALASLASSTNAFVASPPSGDIVLSSSSSRFACHKSSISCCTTHEQRVSPTSRGLSMARKGFGPPPPKGNPMPKSKKRVEKDDAAKAYDEMAAAGIPEYNIFIKPTGTEDYVPAGVMAVPRSQQVSAAVFEQEENLKAAAFKLWEKLKGFDDFEYGYTLKMFPDDPITPIEKRAPSTNPVGRFFDGLMSPVNTEGMKGPPIDPTNTP